MFAVTDGLERWGEKEFRQLLPYLNLQRRKKVDSLKFLPDKIASAAAFVLLRVLLSEEGEKGDCFFTFSEMKKPFLASREDVRFSLSHDRKGVCCALSNRDIGADIQEIFPYEKSLAKRILSPREQVFFDCKEPSGEILTGLWTMKESLGKKRGDGVLPYLKTTDFSFVPDTHFLSGEDVFTSGERNNLIFTVCSDRPEVIRFVSFEELMDVVSSL